MIQNWVLDLEEKYKRVLENPVPKEFTSEGLQHAKEESYNDVNECPICLEVNCDSWAILFEKLLHVKIPEDPLQVTLKFWSIQRRAVSKRKKEPQNS